MTDDTTTTIPSLEDWQHWALVMARANQMIMEAWADNLAKGKSMPGFGLPVPHATNDPDGVDDRGRGGLVEGARGMEPDARPIYRRRAKHKDRRFASPEWRENPIFDTVRQSYLAISEKLLGTVEEIEGLDEAARNRLRFATKGFVDAMSPANFMATNPEVMKRTIETKGENLLVGPQEHARRHFASGQVTQSPEGAFELGRNLATTPGKVIYETRLFQLIQYSADDRRGAGNAAGDLPAVDQPLLHPRPHAEEKLRPMVRRAGRHPVHGQLEIGRRKHPRRRRWTIMSRRRRRRSTSIRDLLGVKAVHTIGYCVAGTTLAATLAYLAGQGARPTRSPASTFFTAQVDFEDPGDLKMFVGDETMATLKQLTAETGVLDGRVMAATFNLLRGRDLIWNYVVNNYLMGNDPAPFDLLHWNGDVTNLPGEWHRDYLDRLYRQNLMMKPGGIEREGRADRPHARSRRRPISRRAARTISPRRRACGS